MLCNAIDWNEIYEKTVVDFKTLEFWNIMNDVLNKLCPLKISSFIGIRKISLNCIMIYCQKIIVACEDIVYVSDMISWTEC